MIGHSRRLPVILMFSRNREGPAEGDRFDVLATLVEAYEEKHWPIDPPDPVDAIKYRMEQAGFGQADLARLLGSRSGLRKSCGANVL